MASTPDAHERIPRRLILPRLLLLLLAVSCSKSEKPAADNKTAAPPAPSKPAPADALINTDITPGVKGGRIVMGIAGDPKTFNPLLVDDVPSSTVSSYLYGSLYGYDNLKQQDMPAIAKKWEYNETTREWTFHLREGLKWSDGEPLTSDDFIFYTELVRDTNIPTNDREYFQSGGKPFTFLAPDPLTFIAQIPEVDSFAWLNLGLIRAFPRHAYEKAWREGKFNQLLGTNTPPNEIVSCGPFRLKEFRSGEKVVLESNPYHFEYDERGTQLPYVSELIMLNVPDYTAMALRFRAGELDIYDDPILPADLVSLLDGQEKGDYKIYSPGFTLNETHFWFNLKTGGSYEDASGKRVNWEPTAPGQATPPEVLAKKYRPHVDPIKLKWFQSRDFRIACSMASNRDAMVKTIFFGEGAPLYGPVAQSNKQWSNPDIPKYPYDLAKAAELLEKAGFIDRDKDGIREDPEGHAIRFTLITNKENNAREKIGVLLKEDLTKLGFGVTLKLLDFNDIVTRTSDSFDYEVCLFGVGSGVPPHPAMAANEWRSSGRLHVWNPEQKQPATEWEAKIDQLYESMKRVFDEKEQKKIFDQMQVIWTEQQCVIDLVVPTLHVGAKNQLGNIKPSVLRPHVTYNIQQHYLKSR